MLPPTRDIPLLITSPSATSERRITPSWTISHLKRKLEPITGIEPANQRLSLRLPAADQDHDQDQDQDHGGRRSDLAIVADDEDVVQVGNWPLVDYAEITVTPIQPISSANVIPSASSVPRYIMPTETYEALPSTVLAFKKSHQIGRFNPDASKAQEKKTRDMWAEVERRGINSPSPSPSSPLRCRISATRHGEIRFCGPIPSLPGPAGSPWIGVALDEPVGKNDGSVHDGTRYFTCEPGRGVFVRPERVEVGAFGVLAVGQEDTGDEEEGMEEI